MCGFEGALSDESPTASRETPRVEADFRVSYTTIDQLVVAYCSDLSKGGMFLATDHMLPIDAVVRLCLELPEGSSELNVLARVAYVRTPEDIAAGGEKPAGMGVQFIDLDDDTLMLVETFISERITAEAAAVQMAPTVRRLSVLVVEDDVACQKLAAAPFRARGDYVRIAPDGFEALAMCLKEPPDVVLCDVHMPRMDGWQLLRMLRARPHLAGIPVIFTTTLSGEDERLKGYQLGVDDYVSKPYRSMELRARVDRLAARSQHIHVPAPVEKRTLRGDLSQVSLGSVLSFLELEQKSGDLLVGGNRNGKLCVRGGRPCRADLDDSAPGMTSREIAFELLDWTQGQFEFVDAHEAVEDDIKLTMSQLLLEHARKRDEAKGIVSTTGSDEIDLGQDPD
jgi:uncharacterized protein (TIGR02266 family)